MKTCLLHSGLLFFMVLIFCLKKLMEECKLESENTVLKTIFGPKQEEIPGVQLESGPLTKP